MDYWEIVEALHENAGLFCVFYFPLMSLIYAEDGHFYDENCILGV
jgi:hypothetical protein